MFGELRTQLQTIGIHVAPTSESTATKGSSMASTEPLLKTQVTYVVAILVGALVVNNVEDKVVIGWFTGLGLNIAALPCKSLQQL